MTAPTSSKTSSSAAFLVLADLGLDALCAPLAPCALTVTDTTGIVRAMATTTSAGAQTLTAALPASAANGPYSATLSGSIPKASLSFTIDVPPAASASSSTTPAPTSGSTPPSAAPSADQGSAPAAGSGTGPGVSPGAPGASRAGSAAKAGTSGKAPGSAGTAGAGTTAGTASTPAQQAATNKLSASFAAFAPKADIAKLPPLPEAASGATGVGSGEPTSDGTYKPQLTYPGQTVTLAAGQKSVATRLQSSVTGVLTDRQLATSLAAGLLLLLVAGHLRALGRRRVVED